VEKRERAAPGTPSNPKPDVTNHKELRAGAVRAIYSWTSKGQRSYTLQWNALRGTREGRATVGAGLDALRRCANASWFEWLDGSAPIIWNWPQTYQKEVRDGQQHFFTGKFGPPWLRPQRCARDGGQHEMMRAKVVKVRKLDYITTGPVRSGTHFFCVPKGDSDIRMVYNGTSCGLNANVWAPRFGLPTVKDTLRSLLPGYYQADLDVGDQFLNFKLHESMRAESGVDVQTVRSGDPRDEPWEASRQGIWERWERNWMGLKDSPYRSIQWQIRLKLEVYGDRRVLSNPFHWDRVEFNLPCSKGYRSDLPWVMKIRCDGHLATEVYVYVDDGRVTGHSAEQTGLGARAYGAGCTRLGVQDASRKRTTPTHTPGPWAGTVTHTDGGEVIGMVSQEKWDRTKALVQELSDLVSKPPLPLHRLLQIRGFLIYVVRTYKWLNPYIKGLHLTIDSWRPGRAANGFKLKGKELEQAMALWNSSRELDFGLCGRRSEEDDHIMSEGGDPKQPVDAPPEVVQPVDCFCRDLTCLLDLTSPAAPPRQLYRAKHKTAFYVVGDASGNAKGAAVVELHGVSYEAGSWNVEWRNKSSNAREAENLTDRIERLVLERALEHHEIFVFTDNSAFEGCYYKGHSTSEELSDIVFRLHKAEREGGFILHVLHISGKRMKASGVDGLSRGDLTEGMMAGEDPLSFIPLNRGADDLSGGLASAWVRSWWTDQIPTQQGGCNWGGFPLVEVDKDNMFELKNLKAARLWMLPPAAMEVALELLTEDRLAHPHWPHVFLVPRLMTHLWRRDLGKEADILFNIPAGVPFWGARQYEPLTVAILFPLSHVPSYTGPWVVKGTIVGANFKRALVRGFRGDPPDDPAELHGLDGSVCMLWKDPEGGSRVVLQQLLAWAGTLPTVQKCMVRQVLQGGSKQPFSDGPEGSGKRVRLNGAR